MSSNKIVQMDYQGMLVSLKLDDQAVNLTEMWKAVGSPPNKRPVDWLRTAAAIDFVKAVEEKLQVGKNHFIKTKRGQGVAGTWGHWQVALAYAKYLRQW